MISMLLSLIQIFLIFSHTTSYITRNKISKLRISSYRLYNSINEDSNNVLSITKEFLSNRLGLQKPDILDDKFIDTKSDYKTYNKQTYLSTYLKQQQSIIRAIPNYNTRFYDIQVDDLSADKVWYKLRPTGTFSGNFSYDGELYFPNNKVLELPVIQGSVTIKNNKVVRSSSDYVIDRYTGNTDGQIGPLAILQSLAIKPFPLKSFPPLALLKNIVNIFKKPTNRLAVTPPLPEIVLYSLTKQLITSLTTSDNSETLFTDDFQASSPYIGPLDKKQFFNEWKGLGISKAIPDFSYNPRNFVVDSFDRDRVWAIVQSSGTFTKPLTSGDRVIAEPTGKKLNGAPEAVSFSFTKEGLCYRATYGYVLDKEIGNTNGLGGIDGILEGIGAGRSWIDTRPIPEWFAILSKAIDNIRNPPSPPPTPKPKPSPVTEVSPPKPVPVITPTKSVPKPAPVVTKPAPIVTPTPKPAPIVTPTPKPAPKPDPVVVKKPIPIASNPIPVVPKPAPIVTKPAVPPVVKPSTATNTTVKPSGGFFSFLNPSPIPETALINSKTTKLISAVPTPAPKPVTTPTPVSKPVPLVIPKTVPATVSKPVPTAVSKPTPSTIPKPVPSIIPNLTVSTPTSVNKTTTTPSPKSGGLFSFLNPSPVLPESSKVTKIVVNKPSPLPSVAPVPVVTTTKPVVAESSTKPTGGFFSFLNPSPVLNSSQVKPSVPSKQSASSPTITAAKPVVSTTTLPPKPTITSSAPVKPVVLTPPPAPIKPVVQSPSSAQIKQVSPSSTSPKPVTPPPKPTPTVDKK